MSLDLLTKELLENAYNNAKKIVDLNTLKFCDSFPPNRTDINGKYLKNRQGEDLCDGFWTGIYILAYEMSEDMRYRFIAARYVEKMYRKLFDVEGSYLAEIGFLYVPSCVSAYRIGKIKKAKTVAVMAADMLVSVYKKTKDGYVVNSNYSNQGNADLSPIKITAMLNCSILYWACEFTGLNFYKQVADDVIEWVTDNLIKSDGTVFWKYDVERGAEGEGFIYGKNCRAISWALYGLAVKYRHGGEEHILEKIEAILKKYVPQIEKVDFCSLDSTMISCMVCAIDDIGKNVNGDFSEYLEFSDKMLVNLIKKDALEPLKKTDGLLGFSDGMSRFDVPQRNASTVVGDYFYFEALIRKLKNFESYL